MYRNWYTGRKREEIQKYSRSKKLAGGPACCFKVINHRAVYVCWVKGWKPEFPEENHPYRCGIEEELEGYKNVGIYIEYNTIHSVARRHNNLQ